MAHNNDSVFNIAHTKYINDRCPTVMGKLQGCWHLTAKNIADILVKHVRAHQLDPNIVGDIMNVLFSEQTNHYFNNKGQHAVLSCESPGCYWATRASPSTRECMTDPYFVKHVLNKTCPTIDEVAQHLGKPVDVFNGCDACDLKIQWVIIGHYYTVIILDKQEYICIRKSKPTNDLAIWKLCDYTYTKHQIQLTGGDEEEDMEEEEDVARGIMILLQ